MKYRYTFTAPERQALLKARQQYLEKLGFVAEIHGITEGLIMADDNMIGLVDNTPEAK